MEKGNIFSAEEKKNREVRKFLEKEFFAEIKTEKEKEKGIRRRKIYFLWRRKNREGKVGKYLEKEYIFFCREEGKGEEYLEREIYCLPRRRKTEKEKIFWRRKMSQCRTHRQTSV